MAIGLALWACGLSGCYEPWVFFACTSDLGCGPGSDGRCELNGACSFPDDRCPSGRRYGEHGDPRIAGSCVDPSHEGGEGSGSAAGPTADDEPPDRLETSVGNMSTGEEPPATSSESGNPDEGCPPGWWDCQWSHRQRIAVAPNAAELRAVELVVPLVLRPDAFDYSLARVDGSDLRFVGDDGEALAHEVEEWRSDARSLLRLRLRSADLEAGAMWLYVGNAAAAAADSDVWEPAEGVVGAWLMSQGEVGAVDATGNNHDASPAGLLATVDGQVGVAKRLFSPSAALVIDATDAVDNAFRGGGTLAAWILPAGWGGGGYGRIADKEVAGTGWAFWVDTQARLVLRRQFVNGGNAWRTPPGALSADTWSHVAVTFDAAGADDPTFYVDGVATVVDPVVDPSFVDPAPSDGLPLILGNRGLGDRQFDGTIDEVMLVDEVRSGAWVRAQHDAGRGTLFELAEPEGLSPSAAATDSG